MKPQVFYEKGVNKMGKPFIKKTTRLKSPIMNHTGKIKGFIHQERVNYISGNKYMNTVSKMSPSHHKMSPSHHKMSHSHHTSLKNIVNDMLKQKSPMRNYVETTRKTPTKKTSTKKKTPTKKKTTKKTTKKTSTKKKETTKKKPTKKTNIKKRPLKRPVNKNKNY